MKKLELPRNLKELIIVILVGAGLIVVLAGAFATYQIGLKYYSDPNWKTIWIGIALIVIGVLLGFFTKSGKNV